MTGYIRQILGEIVFQKFETIDADEAAHLVYSARYIFRKDAMLSVKTELMLMPVPKPLDITENICCLNLTLANIAPSYSIL